MSDVHGVIKAQWEASQRGALAIWTIYDRPTDYPDGFMARRFESGPSGLVVTHHTLAGELERLRAIFARAGLVKMPRQAEDDRKIVESWI